MGVARAGRDHRRGPPRAASRHSPGSGGGAQDPLPSRSRLEDQEADHRSRRRACAPWAATTATGKSRFISTGHSAMSWAGNPPEPRPCRAPPDRTSGARRRSTRNRRSRGGTPCRSRGAPFSNCGPRVASPRICRFAQRYRSRSSFATGGDVCANESRVMGCFGKTMLASEANVHVVYRHVGGIRPEPPQQFRIQRQPLLLVVIDLKKTAELLRKKQERTRQRWPRRFS